MAVATFTDRLQFLQTVAPKVFNFDADFDVSSFDELIKSLYHSEGQENEFAKKVLEEFLQDDRSWCRVDAILEFSKSLESKFYGLLILERLIRTRWKLLPPEQRVGIRDYVVQQIITVGSSSDLEAQKVYLNKLVSTLVEILKFEWPRRWPEFIDEIVASSKISENICLVNMRILRILGEEIFQFSSQMNHLKTKYLREALCSQFGVLFNHIYGIFTESTHVLLITETLKTLTGFMPFIPHAFIFESGVIEILLERLLKEPMFSNDVLSCLAEAMVIDVQTHEKMKLTLYGRVLEKVQSILPSDFDFNIAFSHGTEVQQRFLRVLALFFTQSLRNHQSIFSPTTDIQLLIGGLNYILSATDIQDNEIFKICIEFWKGFTSKLCIDKFYGNDRNVQNTDLLLTGLSPLLSRLRRTVVTHMQRPQEVVIYVNEHGEVVRQVMRETDSNNLYIACRDTLLNLTSLDPEEVRNIILERLDAVMISPEFSWNDLNRVGWAVGSIADTMTVGMERDFLVRVLKNLLSLCDEKKGKDNKAIIASNIMYVVQQYPRFLKPHYRFLKTVVNKLFEFMLETHEGVQDMACDAFNKIANTCRVQLARNQSNEPFSYIEEIIGSLDSSLNLLNLHQLEIVYEALGCIISAVDDNEKSKGLVASCLSTYTHSWVSFDAIASSKISALDLTQIQQQSFFFKIASSFCRSIGYRFDAVLSKMYLPMLRIYSDFSALISNQISTYGPDGAHYSDVKIMRGFKRDALNLVTTYITTLNHFLDDAKSVYFQPFVTTVLSEYSSSHPSTREAEVISLATAFVCTLKTRLHEQVIIIFQHLFDPTLSMINIDMQQFPEHRINFFKLIEAIANFCFIALSSMNPAEFDLIIQSLFYAISHTMPNVTSIGLTTLHTIFKNLLDGSVSNDSFSNLFYKSYFIAILDRVLHLITDGMHSSDLAEHACLLAHMIKLLDSNTITVQLFESSSIFSNNSDFVKGHMISFVKQEHPHLLENQIALFVEGMFSFSRNHDKFIQHLKDFVITIKEYQGQDNDDLFSDELKKEMKEAAKNADCNSAYFFNSFKFLQDYHTLS